MHLIQDENGNLCPHAHGHEDSHHHTHEHSHHHEGDHGHTHDADGCGGDCNGCGAGTMSESDKMSALLDYMLKHNEHHAAELDQVAEKLRAAGKDAAAEQIKKAVDEFQKGNLYLNLALSMVKEAH